MIQAATTLFDKELEKVVLGAILNEKTAIARVGALFRPEMFYVGQHELIAKYIFKLFNAGHPIDIETVWLEVRRDKQESLIQPGDLMVLSNAVSNSAQLEHHVLKLSELFMTRELQKLTGETSAKATDWSSDVFDLVNDLQKNLTDLLARNTQGGLVPSDRVVVETLKYIESIKPDEISGIPTGIKDIDDIFYGYKPGELHIVAARPGCGKSAFALQVRRNAGEYSKKSALFSLEMNRKKIAQRDLAAISKIPFAKIQRNILTADEWMKLSEAAAFLAKLPITIDDNFAQSVQVIHSKCVQEKYKSGLDFIIVDYLQLIGAGKSNKNQIREQVIAEISRGLKGMAKDLDVPVLALSQMSREIEKSGRKEPRLSDLRESGALEQDADSVMFLTSDEDDSEGDKPDPTKPKEVLFTIAKHRDGVKHRFSKTFDGNYMRFTDHGLSGNWQPLNYSESTDPDGPF